MDRSPIALPADLAPPLRARVRALLEEVRVARPPRATATEAPGRTTENRCVRCYGGGKLATHHGADGAIEFVHRSCHRKLHRAEDNRRATVRGAGELARRRMPALRRIDGAA